MRIIAGEYRGRIIRAPQGQATRPTIDRVRESLMSAIASAQGGFDGLRVWDVFAGSGALGIEALSRGASYALLTDKDPKAITCITQNISQLGIPKERFRVMSCDVCARVPFCREAFDLVMIDPPYAMPGEEVARLLRTADEQGLLADDVLITYEYAKTSDISPLFSGSEARFEQISGKVYGETAIAFARKRCV